MNLKIKMYKCKLCRRSKPIYSFKNNSLVCLKCIRILESARKYGIIKALFLENKC
jgi:hypothetical protein